MRLITAYKLGHVTIYPQSKMVSTSYIPLVSNLYYVLPGRSVITKNQLTVLAVKLDLPLVEVQVPYSMPLDRERRH